MKKLLKKLFSITSLSVILSMAFLPSVATAASLTLSPATGTFNKSCTFNLDVKLDTGGVQTDGTDAIILFDNTRLVANSVTPGNIYSEYPGTNSDNNAGKVTISGLASVSSGFSGTGILATINFTVKDSAATGATIVKFDYDPNGTSYGADCTKSGPNTCDSNVVQRDQQKDVLSSVGNGNYTIGTGSCAGSVGAPPAGSGGQGTTVVVVPSTPSAQIPVKEIPVKTLPPAGSEQLTFTIAIVGSVLTILGILGIALL